MNALQEQLKEQLNKKYVNMKTLAGLVGVTPMTVYRWRKKGYFYAKSFGKSKLVDTVFVQLLKNKNFSGAKKVAKLMECEERQTKLDV